LEFFADFSFNKLWFLFFFALIFIQKIPADKNPHQ
jgi:hypothetical protein